MEAYTHSFFKKKKKSFQDFVGGTVDKNLPDDAGDTGSICGLGIFQMLRSN